VIESGDALTLPGDLGQRARTGDRGRRGRRRL